MFSELAKISRDLDYGNATVDALKETTPNMDLAYAESFIHEVVHAVIFEIPVEPINTLDHRGSAKYSAYTVRHSEIQARIESDWSEVQTLATERQVFQILNQDIDWTTIFRMAAENMLIRITGPDLQIQVENEEPKMTAQAKCVIEILKKIIDQNA